MDGERVRTAELIAALSLATDLGVGLPVENGLWSTLVGMRVAERLGVDAQTASQTSRYTTVVPDREIRFDGEVGPLRPRCVFTFAPATGGTTVTLQADPNPIGPLRLLSPLIARKGEHLWTERLQRAKAALESAASSDA